MSAAYDPTVFWPAEWAPQSAVMLTWPPPDNDWGARSVEAESCFAAIAASASYEQRVLITVSEPAQLQTVVAHLRASDADLTKCHHAQIASDDAWARDHGPITVYRDGQPTLLDFRFDGWGGKYPADRDDRIIRSLHRSGVFARTPLRPVDLVVEGGAIESDGAGTLLANQSCLYPPKRNATVAPEEINRLLRTELGVERMLLFESPGLGGDDTDGHVDTLARFADAKTIVHQSCDDPGDPNFGVLTELAEQLAHWRRPDGHRYRVVPLPTPCICNTKGERLPASYTNFLIINHAVLMPVYGDPADQEASDRLAECFPGRRLVPIDCRRLVHEYGSLHCASMQIPSGVELQTPSLASLTCARMPAHE